MDSGGWAGKWPVNASSLLRQNLWRIRGGKGIRTPGLLIANETLYQLSYTPILPMKTASNKSATKTVCPPPGDILHNQPSRFTVRRLFVRPRSPPFEIARVLV